MPYWLMDLLWVAVKGVALAFALLTTFAYMTLIERRLLARMQIRLGPNRVGPLGLLQPAADAIKSIFKEDFRVTPADKIVFTLAPILSIAMALTAFGAIPAGPPNSFFGLNPWVYDLDIGILAVLAITSLGVYGIFLGGWASGSKYPLLGGLRGSAQMISYELGLGLSILGLLMIVGSTRLRDIVDWQGANGVLILFQILGFVLFLISSFAETNRTPFDFVEAEQEIVAGYLTEFNAIKWALFQMAEYVNMITSSAIMATLFFGGWRGPAFLGPIAEWPFVWLILKIAFFLFVFIWVRATLPRLRYDQLMRFGWKLVLPLALFNTVLTGAYLAFAPNASLLVLGLIGLVVVIALIALSDRLRVMVNAPRRTGVLPGPVARPTTPDANTTNTLGGD